jgi:predicted TIM-barrel fold metal-dependent hydrolase
MMISADSHVQIPDEAWQEYLEVDLRPLAPRTEVTSEGLFRVFEGRRKRVETYETLGNQAGSDDKVYTADAKWSDERRTGAWDPVQRLREQDVDSVSAEVIYFGRPLVDATDDRLRLASFRAYNRWLADYCSTEPNRLIGVGAVPADTPDVAIEELRAAHALGFRTVYFPLFPPSGSYSEARWEPFWHTAADLGVPVGLHIGDLRRGPRRFDDAGIFMTENLMSRMEMAEALGELILGGVLRRFPDLVVLSVEAQIGWLPFALSHMDHVWEKHRHWSNSSLTEPPSTYFARQVFATFTDDPVGVRLIRDIGADKVMWSSDYPHSETSWPNSRPLAEKWLAEYTDDERDRILWRNAATVFGIDVAALRRRRPDQVAAGARADRSP